MKRLVSIFVSIVATSIISIPFTAAQDIFSQQFDQQLIQQTQLTQSEMQFMQPVQQQIQMPASSVNVVSREVYAPNTTKLNTLDSIALHTYCTFSKLFANQAQREKCFVMNAASIIETVPAQVDLSGLTSAIQQNARDIQDLFSRPTTGGGTSQTIVRHVNTGGAQGPAGRDGVGITGSVANPNGSVTFYYSNGTSLTTAIPGNQTIVNNQTNCPTSPDPFAVGCNYVYVPVGGGGGTGPQGPAGPAGPPGADGVLSATSTITVGTTTASTTITNNLYATNIYASTTNTFNLISQNASITNATITNLYAENASTTNFFTEVLNAIDAYIQNLFFDNASGTNLYVTNATTTNLSVTNLDVPNTLSRANNILTSNVGGSVGTSTIIGANLLSFNTTTGMLTSSVNGVTSNTFNLTAAVASTSLKYYAESSLAPSNSPLATGDYAVAIGDSSVASGLYSSAFGNRSTTTGDRASAFGYRNVASGTEATAIGAYNRAAEGSSTAIGYSNLSSSFYASSIGYLNSAVGQNAVAFGSENRATGSQAIAIGSQNRTNNANTIAIGILNNVRTADSGAFGRGNVVDGSTSYVFGSNSTATAIANDSITLGKDIINNVARSVQIGSSDTSKMTIIASSTNAALDGWVGLAGATTTLYECDGGVFPSGSCPPGGIAEKLRVPGAIVAQAFWADSGADLAEMFPVDDDGLKEGHIVMFGTTEHAWSSGGSGDTARQYTIPGMMRATEAKKVVGVIATNPGVTLGAGTQGKTLPVSFSGRVPVRVNTENGVITKGDYITLSVTESGVGTKLVGSGQSVGIALSNADEKGLVLVLVRNEFVTQITPDSGAGIADNRGLCIDDLCIDKNLLKRIIEFFNAIASFADFTNLFGGSSNSSGYTQSNSNGSTNTGDNGGATTNTNIPPIDNGADDQNQDNQNQNQDSTDQTNTDNTGDDQQNQGGSNGENETNPSDSEPTPEEPIAETSEPVQSNSPAGSPVSVTTGNETD